MTRLLALAALAALALGWLARRHREPMPSAAPTYRWVYHETPQTFPWSDGGNWREFGGVQGDSGLVERLRP